MKKYFIGCMLAALLVPFVSCTKEQALEEPVGPKTIKITASIAKPEATKTAFESTTEGIKETFEVDDVIMLFDADGNETDFTATSIDENGVATFEGTPETAIAEGAAITAVLKNAYVSYSTDTKTVTANLSAQKGTLADAGAHSVAFAAGTYSSEGVNLLFENKTTIYKFVLTIPEGETATSVKTFWLSTGATGAKTYYNKLSVAIGDGAVTLDESRSVNSGDISVSGPVEVTDNVVTVYVAAPVTPLQNGIIQCVPNTNANKRYVWRVAGSTALTPEAGKTYTITRTKPVIRYSSVGSLYLITDAAQEVNGEAIVANTTGKPKQTTLEQDAWGYKYPLTVTQVEVADLKGDYKFYSKVFNRTNYTSIVAGAHDVDVTIGDPLKGETLADSDDAEVTHTNNLGLRGLYLDTVMDMCVEIDYDLNDINIGFFIDRRKAQAVSDGSYICYVPELTAKKSWGNYNFAPTSFSSNDYDWIWFNGFSTTTITYNAFNNWIYDKTSGTSVTKYVIGFSIERGTSEDVSTLVDNYDVIYQSNYDTNNTMYMVRQ